MLPYINILYTTHNILMLLLVLCTFMSATAAATMAAHATKPPLLRYTGSYLGQQAAQRLDQALFESFSVDSLMELAGLSVAEAVTNIMPKPGRVLVFAGPGNNGGDGLVAARHLFHFGYMPLIVYPKYNAEKRLFRNLVSQCKALGIPIIPELNESDSRHSLNTFDVILDAVFGFSFKPERGVRAPFDIPLRLMRDDGSGRFVPPVISVDIPSGWDINAGDVNGIGVTPSALISLTAPKKFAQNLPSGVRHFLGGRFLPPDLAHEYGLAQVMELYRNSDLGGGPARQVVELYSNVLEDIKQSDL